LTAFAAALLSTLLKRVVNAVSGTVSVIDGTNDTEIWQIPVGRGPQHVALLIFENAAAVTNSRNEAVSVIDITNSKKAPHDIPVGSGPFNSSTYSQVQHLSR
jgi:YVTN family beta-propeller protein